MKIYAGTSGIMLSIRREDYPESFRASSRLSYYSSVYNSLEVNSTFYKLPRRATIERWVAEVENEFRFTFKFPKSISHIPKLEFETELLSAFIELGNIPAERRGCLLIQFPPSLQVTESRQLKKLLKEYQRINRSSPWKLAIEFRHLSWYEPAILSILRDNNVALVMHDMPASAPPEFITTADFTYARFHGPGGKYRGSYNESELESFANNLSASRGIGSAYIYFNNTMGTANADLNSLLSLLRPANT